MISQLYKLSQRDIIGGFVFLISFVATIFLLYFYKPTLIKVLPVPEILINIFGYYILTTISLFCLQKIRKLDIFFGMILFTCLAGAVKLVIDSKPNYFYWLAEFIGISMAILPLYSRTLKQNHSQRRNTYGIEQTNI